MQGLTHEDLDELRDLKERVAAASDFDESIRLGRAFHWVSYRRHKSPLLAQIIERVWDTTLSYRRASLKLAQGAGPDADWRGNGMVYDLLYEAIARQDAASAQASLVLHIRRIRALVLERPGTA